MITKSIKDVAEVAGMLWQKGWAERNGGNITVNITDELSEDEKAAPALAGPFPIGLTLQYLEGRFFYCKGTGKRMRDLARAPMENGSIIRICPDCASYEIIADAPVLPTSELPSHLALHNYLISTGSSYKASLHTHPIELVAMSHSAEFQDSRHLTEVLWSMIPETLAFAPLGIGFVPYAMPSSVELAAATLEQIRSFDVVLWEKHGTVAVGTDVLDAFDQTDVLNKAAQIYLRSRAMGFTPEGMSPAQMAELRAAFSLPERRSK